MKRRKRIHHTKRSRGTPSAQKLAEWRTAGKCMKIPDRDDLVSLYTWKTWWHDSYNPVGSLICDNPSIGAFGMNTSFAMMANCLPEQKDIDNFCNVIAETALVSDVLRTIRMSWRPEGNTSPQFGEWEAHRDFHLKMAKCTLKKIAEREKWRKEDEESEKQYAKKQKAKKARNIRKAKVKKVKLIKKASKKVTSKKNKKK